MVGDAHHQTLFAGHQLCSDSHGPFLAGAGQRDKMPVVDGLVALHIVAHDP
jgi:hypothetical protein